MGGAAKDHLQSCNACKRVNFLIVCGYYPRIRILASVIFMVIDPLCPEENPGHADKAGIFRVASVTIARRF